MAVSALTLDSDAYGRVIAELSGSRYKHFREAGAAVRQQDEIDRLRETVKSPMNGEALASLSDGELTARSAAEAQHLLDGSNLAVSRRLIRLGLERFSRTAAGKRLAYDG